MPQFEGLNFIKILEFARNNSDIDDCLPLYKPGKTQVINIDAIWVSAHTRIPFLANTLIKDELQKFIYDALKKREKKVIEKKILDMNELPKFVQQFKNTNFISCKK